MPTAAEFKCNRCVEGKSLSDGQCKLLANGSKCPKTLKYYQ